tara:strand:+ start:2467 stop:2724 length:258 start_codon:yes stop_codon:yes gene_type:complete
MAEIEIRLERLEQNVRRINELLGNGLMIPNRRVSVRTTTGRPAPIPEGPPPRSRRPRSTGTKKKKKHKKLKKTKSKKNKKSRIII